MELESWMYGIRKVKYGLKSDIVAVSYLIFVSEIAVYPSNSYIQLLRFKNRYMLCTVTQPKWLIRFEAVCLYSSCQTIQHFHSGKFQCTCKKPKPPTNKCYFTLPILMQMISGISFVYTTEQQGRKYFICFQSGEHRPKGAQPKSIDKIKNTFK